MKFKVLIAAILLGLSLPVAAEYEVIQEAHEVRLADLRLPQNETGTVGFKPCDDCNYLVKRVNGNTEWVLDGQKLSLQKFKRNLRRISDRENTPVTVLHHLEDDRVTRVTVSPVTTAD
jgi:hypothetical protein